MDPLLQNEMQSALENILRAARLDLKVKTPDGSPAAPEVSDRFKAMLEGLEELVRGEHDTLSCAEFRAILLSGE